MTANRQLVSSVLFVSAAACCSGPPGSYDRCDALAEGVRSGGSSGGISPHWRQEQRTRTSLSWRMLETSPCIDRVNDDCGNGPNRAQMQFAVSKWWIMSSPKKD